jgi:hypothetical protein
VRLGGSHRITDHYRPAGRAFELLAGVVCTVCGLGLAALGAFGLFAVFVRNGPPPTPSTLLVTLIICAFAALLLVLAWRLILNRARPSDGGLFSPLGLRVGGLIFLAGPIATFFTHPIGLVHTAAAFAAAGACFALARHREHYLASAVPPAA